MHDDQVAVTTETVRGLIGAQFPEWRGLPVRAISSQGTVNAIFRVGDGLAARLPLQPVDVAVLEREAAAARELAGRTRFRTPEPVAIGEPGGDYPLPWSVQTWVPGDIATPETPADSMAYAGDLAEFIGGVRAIDVRGRTFSGSGRGGELKTHDAWMETCFANSGDLLDVPRLRAMWAELRELPRESPDVMTHGDLIPGNVLVADGRLVGVLDVGGFGPADPALDLVGAWHLLESGPRRKLRAELGCGELEWQRGRAWAFQQAMGLAWYYLETNPVMHHLGMVTLGRLLEDG
ncbi:MAG TPA: aminoglycoside phosphotransferase family protein [Actinospica sp.]|jgi:aminoglycoside phosphotransferase (APT) family kinase protein|nr:aminoglycoside phosphotransferase family protein [Actinospica sp.]